LSLGCCVIGLYVMVTGDKKMKASDQLRYDAYICAIVNHFARFSFHESVVSLFLDLH
jgi:hypothetical protein